MTGAVLQVGDGRGFVVKCQNYLRPVERIIIITAAHCLPHLPPCDSAPYFEKRTYGASSCIPSKILQLRSPRRGRARRVCCRLTAVGSMYG
jgi:hypothetical protein